MTGNQCTARCFILVQRLGERVKADGEQVAGDEAELLDMYD